jgi:hypothetical protein
MKRKKTSSYFEQLLEVLRVFVSQVEQTVPRMMGMEAQLFTVGGHGALGAHDEFPATIRTEFELARGTCEMHAAACRGRKSRDVR